MPTFDIDIYRDGKWWMITVPELDGFVGADGAINLSDTTQARFPGEIESMARDFIALIIDTPVEDIDVRRRSERPQ